MSIRLLVAGGAVFFAGAIAGAGLVFHFDGVLSRNVGHAQFDEVSRYYSLLHDKDGEPLSADQTVRQVEWRLNYGVISLAHTFDSIDDEWRRREAVKISASIDGPGPVLADDMQHFKQARDCIARHSSGSGLVSDCMAEHRAIELKNAEGRG
jgi:hypothetical protein